MRKGYPWMGLFVALSLAGCQQTAPKTVTATPSAHPQAAVAEKPLPVPVKPWMWMTGARSESQPSTKGIAGTEGVAAPGNTPPSVGGAAAWRGPQGGLYLLGGDGRYGLIHSGFWKYTPATGLWMRIKGGSLIHADAAAWTGRHGGFWMFGGREPNFKHPNAIPPTVDSLWRYTQKTGWVRMGGPRVNGPHVNDTQASGVRGTQGVASPKNWPGPRYDAATWTGRHGDLWFFGGQSQTFTRNGLWKYTPSTRMWTRMGGAGSFDEHLDGAWVAKPAVYGTRGVAAPGNWPGKRTDAVTWVGPHGSLWLFGGYGGSGSRNDLWKYTPKTGLWTWMGGHHGRPGVRGTLGVPAPTNWPGARSGAVGWTGPHGNLWLYGGGHAGDSLNSPNFVNDHSVWKYTVATGLWTWMGSGHRKGNKKTGFVGTRGVPTDRGPDGASYACAWTGPHGHFWVFGGYGNLNDLWRYTP